jgi:uncharacterized membrane protein
VSAPRKILLALSLFPAAVSVALMPFMPSVIALHYDGVLQADSWGSKYNVIWLTLLVLACTGAVFWFYDKKPFPPGNGPTTESGKKVLRVFSFVFVVMLNAAWLAFCITSL